MDLDAPLARNLPILTLRNQVAKLLGKDILIFNKLSYRAQNVRKSYHLEVASKHAGQMKKLVQYAEDAGNVNKYWGDHLHVSKVTDASPSSIEAKRQCKVSQSHTNYQVSMVLEAVSGIVDVDNPANFLHPVTMNKNVTAFLWHMLLKQGLPKEFIQTLLKKACNLTLFAEIPPCTWDAT
jgi:hypothetical protein